MNWLWLFIAYALGAFTGGWLMSLTKKVRA